MTRLAVLAEVFDDEVERFLHELASQPGFREMQVLMPPLTTELARFASRLGDPGLSSLILPAVVALYDRPVEDLFGSTIEPYIQRERQSLQALFSSYADDPHANPLLYQPEVFLLFERLASDRFRLRESWPDRLGVEPLVDLAALRGVPYGS